MDQKEVIKDLSDFELMVMQERLEVYLIMHKSPNIESLLNTIRVELNNRSN